MPFVDLEPPSLTAPVGPPKGFAVTPGLADIEQGSDAPGRPAWSSTLAAAFRQDNTVGAYFANETKDAPTFVEEGFNTWENIKGTKYEPQWESFKDVRNSRHAELMKQKIDREEEDRKLLSAVPWWQAFPSQLAAAGLDLPTLLPGGAFIRGAKGGFSITKSMLSVGAAGGVSSAAQEAALQGLVETRTAAESAINIGASVFLSGLLGTVGGALLTKAEWNAALKSVERNLAALPDKPSPASGGAAAADEAVTLGDLSVSGKLAGVVAAATQRLNPNLSLLHSPSKQSRLTFLKAFNNSVMLKMEAEGRTLGPSAENLMEEWTAGLARSITASNDSHSNYRKAGGTLSRDEFLEEAGRASRRNDLHEDPHIQAVAQEYRKNTFDPFKKGAIDAKLLPEGVTVETADSYLPRMWNRNRLIAKEAEFLNINEEWVSRMAPRWAEAFDRETLEKSAKLKDDALRDWELTRRIEREARFGDLSEEAIRRMGREIGKEVHNTLTGNVDKGLRPEFAPVQARGPLKERTYLIPDDFVGTSGAIEDFLESNIELLARRHTRVMGADIELKNRMGSLDLAEDIQKIRDDYDQLKSGVTDEKKLLKLTKRMNRDINQIEFLRDILRDTRQESPLERNYSRIVRAANQVNYIRQMGEVVFASLTEPLRPAMVHGLMPYMGHIKQLATNLDAVKMSVREGKLAGNIAENATGHTMASVNDIMDPYSSRSPIEAFLDKMTNVASKWNGIRMWTDWMKKIASVMTQDRILNNVLNYGSVKQSERAYLGFLQIDAKMAERIRTQFAGGAEQAVAKLSTPESEAATAAALGGRASRTVSNPPAASKGWGEIIDGVHVANTEKWTDPGAVRAYRSAMNKDVNSIIVKPSVADIHSFASTPTGKLLLQFKSFMLASHQKILIRGLQENQARFVGGFVAMTTMGMAITYLKALSGNRTELREKMFDKPGWWIGEGIDRSGVFAVPVEASNMFEKVVGVNPIKSPLRQMDPEGSISQKLQNRNAVGTFLGPTIGLADDVFTAAGIPKRIWEGEEVTQGQKRALVNTFPFRTYHGARQIVDYLVVPPAH